MGRVEEMTTLQRVESIDPSPVPMPMSGAASVPSRHCSVRENHMAVTVFKQATMSIAVGTTHSWVVWGMGQAQIYQWYVVPTDAQFVPSPDLIPVGLGLPKLTIRIESVWVVQSWTVADFPAYEPPQYSHLITVACISLNAGASPSGPVSFDLYGMFFE